MLNLKMEDKQEFQKVVNNYKKYGNKLNVFLEELPLLLEKYKNSYQLNDLSLMKGGRLGLLFESYSNKLNKEIVIKIIPEFLNIFEIEANAYKNLSKEYMCPVVEINDNVIVMEKLDETSKMHYQSNKMETKKFFDKVYNNLKENNDLNYNHYMDVYLYYYNCLKDKEKSKEIENIIEKGYKRYNKIFKNEKNYLLHGDLHTNNIMKKNDDFYAIDPLGYVGPKEFTFARFVITELFFTECSQKYLDELLDFISKYSDKNKLIDAIYIDAILFLEALIIQIEYYKKILPKVIQIIELIEKNIKKEMKENENCNNITKTRKFVFRG